MACRSEMPGQDCQYTIASVGLQGQDFSLGLPRQDFQDMTSGIEQPEQICFDIALILAFILALSLNLKGCGTRFFGLSFLHQTLPLSQN